MFTQLILCILIGILFGTITGLIPGIHINLISILILSASTIFLKYLEPLPIAIIILAMGVTHTFLDVIPSTYLGAPDSTTALSILPTHKLLLKGRGYEAVKLATVGSLFGLTLTIIASPLFILGVKFGYPYMKEYIPYILIIASTTLILKDKKLIAFFTYFLSGTFGILVLSLKTLNNPLFPMLSGLFGTSMLFLSLNSNTVIPKQNTDTEKINKMQLTKTLGSGILASTLSGFLPGLGASQAAIIASSLHKTITEKQFIILIGSINTIVMVLSFIAYYVINRARNGAVIVISQIVETFSLHDLFIFLSCVLIVGGIATILTLKISKVFSKIIEKINYKATCITIILFISSLVLILTGPIGLLVLTIATFIGFIAPLTNISRSNLMGCLILPVILYLI